MIEGNDKTRKYITWAAIGFLVLGYVIFFGSNFLHPIAPDDKSFFPVHWSARVGVIFLAMALVLLASTGKNRPASIRVWIISATCLIGMFFLGPQLFVFVYGIFCTGYILYKSFEEIRGFLAKAAKSYRQLRSEIEKN
jgi:hypothetical protein